MDIGYKNDYVGVMYLEYEGVKVYFIDNEYYFNGFTPYGDVKWDIEKFSFFSKAALCILPAVGFQPDILHCHDWQAGLVPVYLKTLFAGNPFFSGMKSVMTIHNLQFRVSGISIRSRQIPVSRIMYSHRISWKSEKMQVC